MSASNASTFCSQDPTPFVDDIGESQMVLFNQSNQNAEGPGNFFDYPIPLQDIGSPVYINPYDVMAMPPFPQDYLFNPRSSGLYSNSQIAPGNNYPQDGIGQQSPDVQAYGQHRRSHYGPPSNHFGMVGQSVTNPLTQLQNAVETPTFSTCEPYEVSPSAASTALPRLTTTLIPHPLSGQSGNRGEQRQDYGWGETAYGFQHQLVPTGGPYSYGSSPASGSRLGASESTYEDLISSGRDRVSSSNARSFPDTYVAEPSHYPRKSPTSFSVDDQSAMSPESAAYEDSPKHESTNPALVKQENKMKQDRYLIAARNAGMSYRDIRSEGNFTEAESTLRGRYRDLTLHATERVRQPIWTDKDVKLLKQGAARFVYSKKKKYKAPWKKVSEYIVSRGGSYRFGVATCSKKFKEVQPRTE